jgi:integrase
MKRNRRHLSIKRGKLVISAGEKPIAWMAEERGEPGELKTVPGRYGDGGGLYLQLGDRSASWLYRYEWKGKERWMGLGPLDWVRIPDEPDPAKTRPNIHEMREAAQKARDLLRNGSDPIEHRKEEKNKLSKKAANEITFRDAAEAWHKGKVSSYKNKKHAAQVLNTLREYAFPKIGKMNIREIDTPHVLDVLTPIWHEKPETASRVRGRIESVLGWATVAGFRDGLNPARWAKHLSELLPKTSMIAEEKPHAALPYAEVPAFMQELGKREALAARALEFTILTAARTGSVIGARWPEIDWDEKVWTIPPDRMKGKKDQRRAIGLLRELHKMHDAEDGFIFIGGNEGEAISNQAMLQLLDRMGVRDRVTVHGFRSSFRDWVSERTAFPDRVAEMCLAHVIKNKAEAAYRRGDLLDARRKVMEAWAAYCYGPVAKNGSNVVSIQGVAK